MDGSKATSQIGDNSFKSMKKKNKLRDNQLWCSTRLNFRTTPISFICERLKNASNILDPIMFADDTNLFFTHKDIRYLFQIVNQELENINQWFISNKLSLNIRNTKYSFFHKPNQKENIPL